MIAAVPLAVPRPEASRHLLPYTCNCLADVYVHRWLVCPWQSHSWACVPFVVDAFGMSTQRPDWPPPIVTFCGGLVGAEVGGVEVGGVDGGVDDGGGVALSSRPRKVIALANCPLRGRLWP